MKLLLDILFFKKAGGATKGDHFRRNIIFQRTFFRVFGGAQILEEPHCCNCLRSQALLTSIGQISGIMVLYALTCAMAGVLEISLIDDQKMIFILSTSPKNEGFVYIIYIFLFQNLNHQSSAAGVFLWAPWIHQVVGDMVEGTYYINAESKAPISSVEARDFFERNLRWIVGLY